MKTRRLVALSLLAAISIGLHYLEGLLPPFLPVPGFRLGLANLITLFALYYYGGPSYVFVVLVKVIVVSLISTGFSIQFFMSLFGSLLSMGVSLFLYYIIKPSIYSASAMGALFHTLGQLLAYAVFFQTFQIFLSISYLGPLSIATGVVMALLNAITLKRLPSSFRNEERKRRG